MKRCQDVVPELSIVFRSQSVSNGQDRVKELEAQLAQAKTVKRPAYQQYRPSSCGLDGS